MEERKKILLLIDNKINKIKFLDNNLQNNNIKIVFVDFENDDSNKIEIKINNLAINNFQNLYIMYNDYNYDTFKYTNLFNEINIIDIISTDPELNTLNDFKILMKNLTEKYNFTDINFLEFNMMNSDWFYIFDKLEKFLGIKINTKNKNEQLEELELNNIINQIKNLSITENSIVNLKYKNINSEQKNIILIDDLVYQNEILYNSNNSNSLTIKYSNNSSREQLETLFNSNFNSIDRLAFVFNDTQINSKLFLNSELFFYQTDIDNFENSIYNNYSYNLDFLIKIIKKFEIKNLDFLVCNSLKYNNWIKYFEILKFETNVVIGASDNETGNIKYGGDWMMEYSNENIKNIYWNENIYSYTTTLTTSTISISSNLNNADLNDDTKYIWPIVINGGTASNPINITFEDNITFNNISQYFILESEYINIDGKNKKIIFDGIINYIGLFNNGNNLINGYSNIQIKNIISEIVNSSSLMNKQGWICQEYFGSNSSNIELYNLLSNGDITNDYSGGICGANICNLNGSININNCSSYGNITSNYSGGICAGNIGENSNIEFSNCYNLGNINNQSLINYGTYKYIKMNINGNVITDLGLYSSDNGLNYQKSNLYNMVFNSLDMDNSGNCICGGEFDGIWYSSDYGKTWQISNKTQYRFGPVKINDNGNALASAWHGYSHGMWYSSDYGHTWYKSTGEIADTCSEAILLNNLGNALAGNNGTAEGGIYASSDYGHTWIKTFNKRSKRISMNNSGDAVALINESPTTYSGSPIYSNDFGYTWNFSENNGLVTLMNFNNIKINESGHVICSRLTYGLYYSNNKGKTFYPSTNINGRYYDFSLDNSGNSIAIGSYNPNIWYSNDYGYTWTISTIHGLPTVTKVLYNIFTDNSGNSVVNADTGGLLYSNDWGHNFYFSNMSLSLSGGILGGTNLNYSTPLPNIYINNCYNNGTVSSADIGINPPSINNNCNLTLTNCYEANGNWDKNIALEKLQPETTPIYENLNYFGSMWTDISPNNNSIPWILSSFDFAPSTTSYTINELKNLNFSALILKFKGYQLIELISVNYTLSELIQANFTISQLTSQGFTMDELIKAGYQSNDNTTNTIKIFKYTNIYYFNFI